VLELVKWAQLCFILLGLLGTTIITTENYSKYGFTSVFLEEGWEGNEEGRFGGGSCSLPQGTISRLHFPHRLPI
jgi:hypothetical protein